jgi:hypothetical protein
VTAAAARLHGLSDRTQASAPPWDATAADVRTTLGTAWIAALFYLRPETIGVHDNDR